MQDAPRFTRVSTKNPEPCSICTAPTQKSVVVAGLRRPLCRVCLEGLVALPDQLRYRSSTCERDILHCHHWENESYCTNQAVWQLYHEGYMFPDRYTLSCREHLEVLSKEHSDGAERIVFVDSPFSEPATNVHSGQTRSVANEEIGKVQFPHIWISRTGGGLGLVQFFDWGRPVEGRHPVWMPVEDIAVRWPVLTRER